jgi:cytochrome c556
MRIVIPSDRRCGCRPGILSVLLALVILTLSGPARSQVRPLVREMVKNLASLNQIGEAMAMDDFERVKQVASDLQARASVLQNTDIASLGVDPGRDAKFDAFLEAQKQAAKAIATAANGEDGADVFLAVQQLTTDACLACHENIRERDNLMPTSVLFMTTFLHAWQDINRGVMLDDLDLVARRAYEIQTVSRVLGWEQVIEATFGVSDATEQTEFRELLRRMATQAGRIEKAAAENRVRDIAEASRRMWTDGCLSCHQQFR